MEQHALGILAWAEEDRPREKLILNGRTALSTVELIAIILGSGTQNNSAVDLAKIIYNHFNNNLHKLSRANLQELQQFKGVGKAKAVSLMAALELARRKEISDHQKIQKINASKDAYLILKPHLSDLSHEVFMVILLNRQNAIIKTVTISIGGVSGTVVDPKIIFKRALDHHASSIILAHNHPSGNLKPSKPDIDITKKICHGAGLLEITVLDHLIISHQGYLSFADEGLI
ncbi:MAG: DNA repair protein RadC [Saprospiraceae bacterium]|nr:DNA repair protein RadC [Saprospiraceae bacterium]